MHRQEYHIFCLECDEQIKRWNREPEGVRFDCNNCGEKFDHEVEKVEVDRHEEHQREIDNENR